MLFKNFNLRIVFQQIQALHLDIFMQENIWYNELSNRQTRKLITLSDEQTIVGISLS